MGCPQDAALSIHYYVSYDWIIACRRGLNWAEYRGTAGSSRCLFCLDGVVPRRFAWCSAPIRYRGIPLGQEGSRDGSCQGSICRRVLYRGQLHVISLGLISQNS
jgi:hypothetical protein